MRGVRLGEALFGASLVALGLFALYKARALPFGTVVEPDAGFFPLLIALLLSVFAVSALKQHRARAVAPAERDGLVRVLVLIAATGAYAWLLPRAGFVVCTVVLLALVLRGLGRVGWLGTIVSAPAATVACYLLFTRLGMPLPTGLLGF